MSVTTATDIINLICQKLGIIVNWTGENALPYIQSLLQEVAVGKYNLHYTLAIIFICVFVVGLLLLLLGIIFDDRFYDEEIIRGIGIFLMFLGIIGVSVAICLAVEWKTMPTVMGYKWIMEIIKQS